MIKTIYVKTTGTCNLNCNHCFTGGRDGDKTQFDPVATAGWVQQFMDHYGPEQEHHIELHGGEPFLVPVDKLKLFADCFVQRQGVSICANSNLTFKLTPEILEFIDVYLGKMIGTSWDYWIRWSNLKQFELWKHNLKLLQSRGVKICLKVSVSRPLVASTADWFLDQMDALSVDEVSLERITVGGNATVNRDVLPDNEEQDNWYLNLYKRYKERNPTYQIRTLDLLEEKLKWNAVKVDTNCRNCEQNMVTINSNGTLGGCPNAASEHQHASIQETVQTFLVSEGRVDEIVKELDFPTACVYCDVFDLCGGDCHRLSWQAGRCGGLKNTLRYLSGRTQQSNLILKV